MSMSVELLKATVGIAVVLGVWLAVQRAWQSLFPGVAPGGDALAGRSHCGGCSCETPCENNRLARETAHDPD